VFAAAALATIGPAVAPGVARADTVQACIDASERAQQLRNAGKLNAAREALLVCGGAECPRVVREDCTKWMTEVLSTLPTIVPGAKDARGRDLVDVRVLVDGKLVTDTLDGRAYAVDPGVHAFRFEASGAGAIEERVVIRQAEKNRLVVVSFEASSPTGDAADAGRGTRGAPVAALVVGGVGVAALATALAIDLGATGDAHELRDTCAPRCAQSDVDAIETRYTIAGITAGVGAALLVGGVVLFFVQRGSSSRAAGATALGPHFAPSGSGALLRF